MFLRPKFKSSPSGKNSKPSTTKSSSVASSPALSLSYTQKSQILESVTNGKRISESHGIKNVNSASDSCPIKSITSKSTGSGSKAQTDSLLGQRENSEQLPGSNINRKSFGSSSQNKKGNSDSKRHCTSTKDSSCSTKSSIKHDSRKHCDSDTLTPILETTTKRKYSSPEKNSSGPQDKYQQGSLKRKFVIDDCEFSDEKEGFDIKKPKRENDTSSSIVISDDSEYECLDQ